MLLLLMESLKLDKGIKNPEFAKAFGYSYEQDGLYYEALMDLPMPERHPDWSKLVDKILKDNPRFNMARRWGKQIIIGFG